MTQLQHLSLDVNLTRIHADPFSRISGSDSRAENENALSLSLARALPHIQSVEFQWKPCSSSGAGEKTVFTVLKRQELPTSGPKSMVPMLAAERITINKKYMSKANERAAWQRCFFSGPSGVYSWTVK